ncbi:hypothetical protein QQ045_011048 [Rhodiola kirilowii]
MSAPKPIPTPQPISSSRPLQKTLSCFAPDVDRELAWEQKRKTMLRRSKSLTSLTSQVSITDHDVDELKACFELGFSFDRSKPNPKLLQTLPALHLYYEVVGKLSRSSSLSTNADSSAAAYSGSEPCTFRVSSGDDPVMAKMLLKQWAHVVGCSIRDSAMNNH